MLDAYVAAGWQLVRIPPLAKGPTDRGWPTIEYPPASFAAGDNTGVKLGAPSGGLVDVDLDCDEAVALAPAFLPATCTFGRASKRRSHWLYVCAVKTHRPSRIPIELRSTGLQTVVPPSIHPSGEAIEWTGGESGPTHVEPVELVRAFGRLAAATHIARLWPQLQAGRAAHESVLRLAGALWHAGWTHEDAESLILPAAELGGGHDDGHRRTAIASTFADHDGPRTGWPKLEEILGTNDTNALKAVIDLVPSVSRSVVASTLEHGALTDVGNAERFIAEHSTDLRHVRGIGWLRWDGTRWADTGEPVAECVATIRGLGKLATASGDAALLKWSTQSEARSKIDACLSLASRMPGLALEASELDADALVLNVTNGIVDLRTGQLREHDRVALCSKLAPVEYDPRATAPRFAAFLGEVFAGDQQIALYVLRFLGYALTGLVRDQVLGLWYGAHGANGKGTLLELAQAIMGDYACTIASHVLLGGTSQHPTSLMTLRGKRLVVSQEVDEGKAWNESLVKTLTGGDRITAHYMRQDDVTFAPTHKLVVAVNARPIVRGQGGSFWRRVQLVPWTQSFAGREDTRLGEALANERAGVLALLVAGCLAWQRDGLAPPRVVAEQVDEYRRSQDTIGQCLDDLTEPGDACLVSELFARYGHWASMRHEHVLPASAFARVIEERGHRVWRGRVLGVRLRKAIA
jgi:P4 family phage/plasmid primase-like protien